MFEMFNSSDKCKKKIFFKAVEEDLVEIWDFFIFLF